MALTREERAEFLAEPLIAALSVDAGEKGRAPLSVPVWYEYEPGGEFWILTGRDSRKDQLIAKAGRFTLMMDRLEPTIRYVSVEGPVTGREPATRDRLHALAARYLPADKVDAYVDFAWDDHGEQVILRMRPERWLSSDLGRI
ncbi:pyridoxamine 5'-phosphate oxidase [Streptomyces abyssalis]|uniref:Pyridoxamine 5'-phosphate oxidase n=1 Tax=Streptomyces abyssalis TaxID=933944 RepID=A0A1E7JND3_9ACTN|nr:pyridoxamine 5'-phosphate oxidase family protein [Streptomyces abyssalis]OEU86862.1 pyridoxamine 5'-phosphate oxidase [Streptomyces abyssalis]OEU89754.1 pyridoxamine 5'-phosphate oxidase [Streptomyces abyssalis]OEV30902.1 pyridoxamine 5'-phosphate oxidase [Streptomyces nanshensis]